MQTFLPYPNYACSAMVLDRQRLGKQILEARQILAAIRNGGGWRSHPAVRAWRGSEPSLALYHNVCLREWLRRGYAHTENEIACGDSPAPPPWLGREEIHASHRAALLAKDPTHYRQFGWLETPSVDYIWPV